MEPHVKLALDCVYETMVKLARRELGRDDRPAIIGDSIEYRAAEWLLETVLAQTGLTDAVMEHLAPTDAVWDCIADDLGIEVP